MAQIFSNLGQSITEVKTYTIDFTAQLPTGVTVSSATATHTPPTGGTPTTPTVTVSSPYVYVTFGPFTTLGQSYVDVAATLSNSDIRTARLEIDIPGTGLTGVPAGPFVNLYATPLELQAWLNVRGQADNFSASTVDDGVLGVLLQNASRYFDQETRRKFFPYYQTQLFDVPDLVTHHVDTLIMSDDLLQVVTITNGDLTTVTTTDYILIEPNHTPYYAIKLRNESSLIWQVNSHNGSEQVISVAALWGYHDDFANRAKVLGGTLGAAISDTTTLTFTMTAGHSLVTGYTLIIDTEIFNVTNVVGNTVTAAKRGDNGSTAATHLISAPVYIWHPVDIVHTAVLEICQSVYQLRSGQASNGKVSVTAAGIVIRPEEVPAMAQRVILDLMRYS